MSQAMTTDHLIRSIKKRGLIPTNQVTFTDSDMLEFADEEMLIGLVPSILQLHEDYYLFQEDIALEADTSSYAIPSRAMGSKLRDLSYVDTSGGIFKMVRMLVEDEVGYNNTNQGSSALRNYFLKNNEVKLMPGVSSSVTGSLRFSYYMRPNQLVAEDRGGLITDIDFDTGVITLEAFPDHFSTDIQYDFLMGGSFFKVIEYDVSADSTDQDNITITFDVDSIPESLVVGDYVMQAGETVIPNIPTELHSILALRVACLCLEGLGDTQGLTNALARLQKMEVALGVIIDNRVEGSPQKVVNRNSLMRNSYYWRRF